MTRRHFKSIASAEVGVLGWLVDWILGEFVATEGHKNWWKYQVPGVFELVEIFSQIARLWKLCSFPFKEKDRWYPTIIFGGENSLLKLRQGVVKRGMIGAE